MTDGPLIVQSDKSLLLEVDHPDALACRMAIAPFAELERSPEHIHTYRLTPLGLWNARTPPAGTAWGRPLQETHGTPIAVACVAQSGGTLEGHH